MAAGCSFYTKDIETIKVLFNKEVYKQTESQPSPIIYVDKFSSSSEILTLNCVDEINALQPYGREFEYPVFAQKCVVKDVYAIGRDKTHAKVDLEIDGTTVNGVWFKARRNNAEDFSVKNGDTKTVIFTIKDNYFRDQRNFQLTVSGFD
jgi:single-stranded-DNA-specific exonuclease